MGYRRHTVPSKKSLLLTLLALSIVALLLPRRWTGGLISLVQIIVPFQDAASVAMNSAASALDGPESAVSAEAYHALEREKAALQHQVTSLAMRAAKLEKDVQILTATRLWGGENDRIGSRGSLIPARVVSGDIVTWRNSRLINAGSLQGVRPGDAVTSQYFAIDRGDAEGITDGMAVLRAETLVGIVDEKVGTHTARVKLLSDVSVQMKVRIGRLGEDGFLPVNQYFWLTGRGGRRMEIREVDRRDVQDETIQTGDIVLSDPIDQNLPAPMVIGKIAAIKPDRDNPLLATLLIEPAVDHESLRHVYVFDPIAATEDSAAASR